MAYQENLLARIGWEVLAFLVSVVALALVTYELGIWNHRGAVCRRTLVGGSWIIFVIANITELAANRNDEFRDFTGSI
jgi:hypothetical protein